MSPKISKILEKYSTKQTSTWIIEGVSYQGINAPNLSRNDGLSKEIENREHNKLKCEFEQKLDVFREREVSERKRRK